MDRNRLRRLLSIGLATTVAVVLAGCASSPPTPIVVFVTPQPTPSPIIVYVTPEPTPTAAAPAAAAPTVPPATPSAEITPTPEPTAAPTSPGAACAGNDKNKAFFVAAAHDLPFDVYCAVLPSSWWVQGGNYTVPNGGFLQVRYQNSAGAVLVLTEGNTCPSPAPCPEMGLPVGPGSFGGLAGTLYSMSPSDYAVYVGPAGRETDILVGSGVSKSTFVAWAATLHKVPRT
jgi:hypothetical protein